MVRFDFNKADIKEQYYPVLDEVAQVLTEKVPEAIVVLAGHTDNTGTEKYNDALSVRRAKAVASYLTGKRGISPNRLILKGYGEGAPIATNDTAEGRAKNRRVEILDAGKPGEPPFCRKVIRVSTSVIVHRAVIQYSIPARSLIPAR